MAERGTQGHWDANVQAGRDNAWVHSDHRDYSAYALGQAQGGWAKKSPSVLDLGLGSGGTASPSTSIFTPSSTYRASATSADGGRYSASCGQPIGLSSPRSARSGSGFLGKTLSAAFLIGLAFGIIDNVRSHADPYKAAQDAASVPYMISSALGAKVASTGPQPVFQWAGWAVQWGIAIPFGFTMGSGAFVGSFGSTIAEPIIRNLNQGHS
jgi:hypothetical protein